jgi:hypothetical protein
MLVTVHPAMLSGRDVKPESLLIVDHDPIGTQIYPALVRILSNVQAPCSDITPSIHFVPERGRKREDVDLVSHPDILKDRAILYESIGYRLRLVKGLDKLIRKVDTGKPLRKSEGHIHPFATKEVGQDSGAFWISGNSVKEGSRCRVRMVEEFRSHPNLLLPGCTVHIPDFPDLPGLINPAAQFLIAKIWFH